MTDILKLAANMQKVGIKINGAGQDTKQYENILKSIQVLFAGEEILYETEYHRSKWRIYPVIYFD